MSSGALDLAKVNLEQMLRLCAEPLTGDNVTEDLTAAQTMSLRDVIHELVRQVTSPNTLVRDQVGVATVVFPEEGTRGQFRGCSQLSAFIYIVQFSLKRT